MGGGFAGATRLLAKFEIGGIIALPRGGVKVFLYKRVKHNKSTVHSTNAKILPRNTGKNKFNIYKLIYIKEKIRGKGKEHFDPGGMYCAFVFT